MDAWVAATRYCTCAGRTALLSIGATANARRDATHKSSRAFQTKGRTGNSMAGSLVAQSYAGAFRRHCAVQ